MDFNRQSYYNTDTWERILTVGRYAEIDIVTAGGVKRAYVDERNGVLTFDFEGYDRLTYGGGE